MKNIKITLIMVLLFTFSCEEYLDIAPEAVIEIDDVFATFESTQGFVEEMYSQVTDYGASGHTFMDYVYGDDGYATQGFKYSVNIDQGQLDRWTATTLSYLALRSQGNGGTDNTVARNRPRVWRGSVEGIRKANIVIASEDFMGGLTQEEKNVVLGQAYFFRAFFHNEIMKFWGRLPHIQEVFQGDVNIPRPETYKEAALSINEDYKKAIELLPVDWDNESYGQRTLGDNAGRVTKGAAYAFQGKNLLLAASPLMHFNNQPGIDTYTYDTELANMAAEAFAEVLKLEQAGRYSLAKNMEDYETVLWRTPRNTWPALRPEANELIFAGSILANNGDTQRFMLNGWPRQMSFAGVQTTCMPHSYIHQNFGMANGLSVEDDLSGEFGAPTYDPNMPFENRDPRFDAWIALDRDVVTARPQVLARDRVLELYIDGEHRKGNASTTGYLFKRFVPYNNNGLHVQRGNNIAAQFRGARLHMRLTDVYLMYAEALHVAKGPQTNSNGFALTAEQAINILRDRAGVPNVHPNIVADNNRFMDEIRRERAVELSWEAHRWTDIRRWGVAHLPKYKRKTELQFDEGWTFFEESLLVERVCEYPKHYWLPFEQLQTQIYEGFPQNPGW